MRIANLADATYREISGIIQSYLDRLGENGILSVFVNNEFAANSAIKKGLAFEFQAYCYSWFDRLDR